MANLNILAEQDFRGGAVNAPWRSTGDWTFERGEARPGDGAALVLELDEPQQRLELEMEVMVEHGAAVVAAIGTYRFQVATEAGGVSTIHRPLGPLVADGLEPRLALGRWHQVRMAFGPEGLSVQADRGQTLRGTDPDASLYVVDVVVHGGQGLRFRNVAVRGESVPAAERPKSQPHKEFLVAMTVDFADDLLRAERPWVEKDFRGLVAQLHEWGIQRVYWIYNGDWHTGRWNDCGLFFADQTGKAEKTFRNVPSPLSVVADEAHKRGMTAYAIIKPYDFANNLTSLPDDPDQLPPPGTKRLWSCGGYATRIMPFLTAHPELLMQRHPYGTDATSPGSPVRTIEIYSHDDAPFPFAASDVKLLVSDDNARYRPYSGPVRIVERVEERREVVYHWSGNRQGQAGTRVRVLALHGLDIREKYFAVKLASARPGPLVANRLCALAEVFMDGDEPLPFTLGMRAKQQFAVRGKMWRWMPGTLEEGGANFEFLFGIPSFRADGFGMDSWWAVDSAHDFLAFCRGKSPHAYALSYAHKESRDFLVSFVAGCLDTGVDGVDLRLNSHCSTFEPQAYGFNPPVVEEFRRRYGVDVLTEDFDWFDWQKLQGEYLTQAIREVSSLIRSRGKKCQVHLGHYCATTDRQVSYFNLYHDWKTWLREGLVDETTHKDSRLDSPLCHDVRALSDELGLPFYECRRHGCIRPGETWGELESRVARTAREFGMDGVIFYENAEAQILGGAPGTFEVVSPELAEVIRSLKT